jgi:hypothetical protein
VAIILGNFWWLWIWDLLDESGADAHRLVEVVTTFRTTVRGHLNFVIRISGRPPLWLVTVFSTGSTAVSTGFFVVVLVRRGRRLIIGRLFFARWRMRSFMPPELRPEPFVLLAELFVFFLKPFVFFVKRSESFEDFFLCRF